MYNWQLIDYNNIHPKGDSEYVQSSYGDRLYYKHTDVRPCSIQLLYVFNAYDDWLHWSISECKQLTQV